MLKAWLSRRAERRAVKAAAARFVSTTSEADIRSLFLALDILRQAGKVVTVDDVERFSVSGTRRYCAMTLKDAQTYAVDLREPGWLHWSGAGVEGFDGERLCLEPDERRFALEAWWVEPYLEDLNAPLISWQRLAAREKSADPG